MALISIHNLSNINIKYKDIDISQAKILCLSMVRNPSLYCHYINAFIKELSEKVKIAKFSFISNNNSNETEKDILNILGGSLKENVNITICPDEKITLENRIEKFAHYRNINFDNAINTFGIDFDYVIVFDSDLIDKIPVDELLNSLKIENDWSCISANCTWYSSNYHYDIFALRLKNQPIDICETFPRFKELYGISPGWMDRLRVFNQWVEVDSAFGCCSVYKMKELLNIKKQYNKLYDISDFPKNSSEHLALNYKLPNIKLINPNIRYINSANLENIMTPPPTAFVPRDAGFFSVFNFLIGSLTSGARTYPLWNKEELLNRHGTNDHFAYWADNSNCWFDYFEPISFFSGDTTHLSYEYLKLPRYSGEHAPDEFRIPKITQSLLKSEKQVFNSWRQYTHQFYNQYIKFKEHIVNSSSDIWNNLFDSQTSNVIGVHYRHPSHAVESGIIYLENYFNEVDKILQQYPDSKIFIASDTKFGIYSFIDKYGDKIRYIKNVDRLSMSEFLHWSFGLVQGQQDTVGFINGKGYELHHKRIENKNNKKMTQDLLNEILCLTKCNQLVATTSNIPLAISYMNPNIDIITL